MVHKLNCYRCKSDMWLPDDLHAAAIKSEKIAFYCAYGHEQCFAKGETEEALLRRERDRLKQEQARLLDEVKERDRKIDRLNAQWGTLKAEQARLTKRASAGVCPECHRQFANMAKHMHSKHPHFGMAH